MERDTPRRTKRPPKDDPPGNHSTRPYDTGSLTFREAYDETYKDAKGQLRSRRHEAVWIGSIRVNGQRRSVSAPTQKAAASKLRALVKAKHQKTVPTGSRKNLAWLAQEWLASKSNREANTLSGYESKLRDWIVPRLGRVTLKHLDTPAAQTTVQRFLNDCAKQLGPKSVKHLRDTVCNILNWAAKPERAYLSRNWVTGVELPQKVSRKYRFTLIEPEHFTAFQQAARGHRLVAALTLLFSRGLRPEEVLGLCLSDINFNTGAVTLQHKLVWVRPERDALGKRVCDASGNPVPGHFEVKDTLKTEESSDVFTLEPQELALLKARKKQQAAERLKAGEHWIGNPWGLLFTTDSGQPCHLRDLDRPFQRFLKASGFQGKARLYDLRHAGISFVAATFGLKEAQGFARHKQFSTTADVYAHVADRRKQEVGRAMGGLVLAPSAS